MKSDACGDRNLQIVIIIDMNIKSQGSNPTMRRKGNALLY